MAHRTPVFVNRERELSTIYRLMDENRGGFLLLVAGVGGVGKTALIGRVLREERIRSSYQIGFIDFDLRRNQNSTALRQGLVHWFTPAHQALYHAKAKQLEEIEQNEAMSDSLRRSIRDETKELFFAGLAEAQQRADCLLVVDTFEQIQDTDLSGDFCELLSRLDRTFVVVAGRHTAESVLKLQHAKGGRPDHSYFLEVLPFEAEHSASYFNEVVGDVIDEPTRQKLHFLAGGRPIFLGLASTWFLQQQWDGGERHASWQQFLERPLAELQKEPDKYRQQFEYEIVGPLRDLNLPLNWAVLHMALMTQLFDETTAGFLLNLEPEEAARMVADLRSWFFVRDDMTLHDEMRRLVLEYIWPYVDQTGKQKEISLHRLLALAQRRMQEAETRWDRFFYDAEILHYHLLLDFQKGFASFLERFERALNEKPPELDHCEQLLQTIEGRPHGHRLTFDMQNKISVEKFDLYYKQDRGDRVKREADKLWARTHQAHIPDDLKIEALSTSAFMLRNRYPEESIKQYEEALRLARANGNTSFIASLLNYSGMVLRRLGEYDQAAAQLNESRQMAGRLGDEKLKAAAMNNLAYLYRQRMEPQRLEETLNLALMAHALRQHIDDSDGLAYSKQTLGEIYRDRNDLARAVEYLSDARRLFVAFGMERQTAQVDLALANIDRLQDQPLLAEETLEWVIATFHKFEDYEYLSAALNEYGCALRKQGRDKSRNEGDHQAAGKLFERAEEQFNEGMKYSNTYRRADNLADMALLYHYWLHNLIGAQASEEQKLSEVQKLHEMRRKAQDAAYWAIEIARGHDILLPESRALEALGDLYYFAEGKYFKAFALFYLPACVAMAPYYGSELHRCRVVFDRVKRRLLNPAIGNEQIRYIARYMARRWEEEGLSRAAPTFLSDFQWIADNWGMGVL